MLSDRFESTVRASAGGTAEPDWNNIEKKKRARARELPVEQRAGNFNEVEAAFSVEEAIAEAERCLNCALCSECMECVAACDKKAVDHAMREETVRAGSRLGDTGPGFQGI